MSVFEGTWNSSHNISFDISNIGIKYPCTIVMVCVNS